MQFFNLQPKYSVRAKLYSWADKRKDTLDLYHYYNFKRFYTKKEAMEYYNSKKIAKAKVGYIGYDIVILKKNDRKIIIKKGDKIQDYGIILC